MTRTMPDKLDRARMALSEIGADPSIVSLDTDGMIRIRRGTPWLLRWLLRCTAASDQANILCWPCAQNAYAEQERHRLPLTRDASFAAAVRRCTETRPFVRESCGAAPVDRTGDPT
jgi:hypothetical protein